MKYLIHFFFIFLPVFVFSTKVLPESDIAFFKNDTLLIDKAFSDVILEKISLQSSFKYIYNPVKVNYYTAYWEISENDISLIKVSNQPTFNWQNLNQYDTLDLKKAFGKRYVNGKVSFKSKKMTLYLHKPYILRRDWGWFPTYIEDYTIQFKKNRLINVDTAINYKNDGFRLNRYSRVQLEETIFNLLTDSININSNLLQAKRIEFSVAVTINNAGKFDTLALSQIRVTDFKDSVYYYEHADSIIPIAKLNKIMTHVLWDEINKTNNDNAVVSYEFDFIEMKLTHERFSDYLNREKKYINETLPWYLRDEYEK